MRIEIGTASADQGTKGRGFLDVVNRPDGSMIRLPLIIVNGIKEGPTVCIDGCVHGTEVEGCEAIMKLGLELDPKKVRGVVLAVPVVNPQAFEARWRVSPVALYDFPSGGDVNLSFPGRQDGGIPERIAYKYFKEIVSRSNYLITCHNTGSTGAPVEHVIASPLEFGEISKKSVELAKAFGLERVIVREKIPHGTLHPSGLLAQATMQGVCTILPEIGAHSDSYMRREYYVGRFIKGFKNVLMHLGMLEGKPDLPKTQYIIDFSWKRGRSSGMWLPEVKVGDAVKKGATIGRIVNPFFGDEIERVEAPHDGIVCGVHAYSITDPSDNTLFAVGRVLEAINN